MLLGEIEALARQKTASKFHPEPAKSPQPVLLLPGFGAHPLRMRKMELVLREAGHHPYQWGLGFNLGPTEDNFSFLLDRVHVLAAEHGEQVSLVGWSLGGLFARELACRAPDKVRRVITMGTPFSGDPRSNNAWRAYQLITGHSVDEPPVDVHRGEKPPVFTVALWSPRDGIITPRAACGWPQERDRAVALRCGHLGFANSIEAITEVLRQLDSDD